MQPLQSGDPAFIGRYSVIGRLGAGGMGWVFLARTPGGRNVAVKAVRPELAREPEFRERFRREVEAARSVSGRYTAAVVDADPDAETPWLATAFIPGMSLRAVVADGWRLPEDSLTALAAGLSEALLDIHRAHLIHRDLKPSNVMVAVDGPRVIDFGISQAAGDAAGLTRTGTLVGSPGFMSPEQIQGQALTPASDVFSLGSVLAFAATGRNPFGEGPEHALLYRIAHGEPSFDDVPASLVPVIAACLAKDPQDRPTPRQILERTVSPPTGTWLPAALTAAIARSATEILDFEGVDTTRSTTPQSEGPSTLVLPPLPPTMRLSRERIAEPVMDRTTVPEPPRNRLGIAVAVVAIAAIGIGIAAALLAANNNGSSPPSPAGITQTSSIPQPSSSAPTTQTPATTAQTTTSSTTTSTTTSTTSNPAPSSSPSTTKSQPSTTPPTSASTSTVTSSSAPPTSTAQTQAASSGASSTGQ